MLDMVLLAQFSLYVHKGGLEPDSFHLLDMGVRWLEDLICYFIYILNINIC